MFDLIRRRAFRLVGRVWSLCPVSEVWSLVFLFFKGSTWYYFLDSRSPFHVFFCIGFQTCFSARSEPEKVQNGNQNSSNSSKSAKKTSSERTHRQELQKGSLEGVKPLKLTTITTLPVVFPKAQRSQSEAKKEAEIEGSGTQDRHKLGNKKTGK